MFVDDSAFWTVYEVVVDGVKKRLDEESLKKCVDVASKNKVLLHFLTAMDVQGEVRVRREAKYKSFLEDLHTLVKAFKGLDYVFIKLRKPIRYVPADVDVLLDRSVVRRACKSLKALGFRVEVVEPYTLTLTRGSVVVDLYAHLTLANMVYVDGSRLLERKELVSFEGIEIPVLETCTETLLTIAHAVYKERIYTLNDYVTVNEWFTEETLKLAREYKCLDAVREAVTIHSLVEEGKRTLPYKIPLAKWILLLKRKVYVDELARTTLLKTVRTTWDKRFGYMVKSKLFRETY